MSTARLLLLALVCACVMCASATADPLVRVTGASPYPAGCGTTPYPDSEVEFSLARDPRRPKMLVGAWIQDQPRAPVVASSRDGGRTWTTVVPPALAACTGSEFVRSTDPWVSVGPDGTAYLVSLLVGPNGIAPALQVSRSGDTGRTWAHPVFVERRTEASEPDDKPTLIADPYAAGQVYITWSRQRAPGGTVFNEVYIARSTDGAQSWSAPNLVDRPPAEWTDADAQVLMTDPGQLLCVFSRRELGDDRVFPRAGGAVEYYATRSTDNGRSWSPPVRFATGRSLYLQDTERSTPIRSATTHVFSAVAGPRGLAHVAWSDVTAPDASQIMLATTHDGGRTWNAPRAVAPGAVRPLNPDVAIARSGAVAVRFQDLRDDRPGDAPLSMRSWLRIARDGGHFTTEGALGGISDLRTAPVAGGATPGRFVGEYQGLTGLANGFGALFVQAQPLATTGATDGFFARVPAR
jgi:hypothetical protein